jgi:hypothetical protein
MYKLVPNNNISYGAVPMDTDHELCKNIVAPLDVITNGSLILINGSSGSGKTSLLVNLISKTGTVNGFKQSFRRCFHKIILCSPSTATLKQNVFKIPEENKYIDFHECMEDLDEHLEASQKQGEEDETKIFNLLILDDVAAALRQNRYNEMKLTKILQNRRHKNLTCIIISQKWTMIPTGIRSNANIAFFFRPKTMQEQEAITQELLNMHKKDSIELFKFIFDDSKYAHLMVDMSLKRSNSFRYFKTFQEIIF